MSRCKEKSRYSPGMWWMRFRSARWGAAIVLIAAIFSLPVWAQEAEPKQQVPLPGDEGEDLIERIKEGMEKIDENLLGARSTGAREGLEENIRNLEKLLEETQNRSSKVIQDLDELIKSVKYTQCPSGQGGTPPPDSKDSQQEENKPRQEQQEQGLQENPSQEQASQDPRPEDARPEEGRGRQDEGEQPPSAPPEQADHADLSGRWGVLPPKVQQDILNFNIEEFPEKYRKWLEDYYKRVNQRQR